MHIEQQLIDGELINVKVYKARPIPKKLMGWKYARKTKRVKGSRVKPYILSQSPLSYSQMDCDLDISKTDTSKVK